MDISIVGVGHVGLVTAAVFADLGHRVVGLDSDREKLDVLRGGGVPFHEPDLSELLACVTADGSLTFTDDMEAAVHHADVVFVCVGTPPLPGGGPDLRHVEAVGQQVARHATRELVLVEKSTVPANTGHRLAQVIERERRALGRDDLLIHVASNPEFLREGNAVADTARPDHIVYGTSSEVARDQLRAVYAPMVEQVGCPVVETDVPTAELIKHASNAFLATRLSFINAVANICDKVGADVELVAQGMGHDARIGHSFLRAGIGYGGSCFPKDVDAFIHLAGQVGYDFQLLEEVRRINQDQRALVLDLLRGELWHLQDKTITILGAAFKPGTDDLREAPGLHLANALLAEGARVRIFDPVALPGVPDEVPGAELIEDPLEACRGAHAAVIATEWPQIAGLAPADIAEALDYPILIDGRNCIDPQAAADAGLYYHGIGRGHLKV